MAEAENRKTPKKGYAFGTFKGVFTPSILTILGVVMYLRFGWVLGSVGLPSTLAIVTLATSITFFTGLSISALATNMKVGGGGAYFIISRSLGLEAGAAIGLPLFFAQSLGIAFYVAGFAEALTANFGHLLPDFATARTIAAATLIVLTLLAYVSADLALKTQFLIFAVIFASLVSFFAGGHANGPIEGDIVPKGLGFWSVFAVFFPAVTGIEAGVAMSGDLKNPARALPLGTLGAVLTGYVIYMALPLFLAYRVHDAQLLLNPNVMRTVARWGGPIVAGVFAASLSSALGALLGAPRTLQALANDRILPRFIGKGYGTENDPRFATAISFLVALCGVMLGDLNKIAPILSMFFLTSYGLLNLSAGLEGLISSPAWRPKFRTPWYVSLLGAFACFSVMLLINAGATIAALFVIALVFASVRRRKLNAHWDDMRYGILMLIAQFAIRSLSRGKPDERTWNPNILVLSGSPKARWHLVEMAHALAHRTSAVTVASILPVEDWTAEKVRESEASMREYLHRKNVDALVKIFPAPDMLVGAKSLVRAYGYGPIAPNTILMGETENRENYVPFAELIRLVYRTRRNLVMLRESEAEFEGESDEIHVWWGGGLDNIGLMLTLAYQIKKSDAWRESNLVLHTIVEQEEDRDAALERLERFVAEQRIPAKPRVLLKNDRLYRDIIRDESADAGLVFLGMRSPGADESVEDYAAYYAQLIEASRDMPPVAFILAAESIEFRQVIGLSDRNRT